MFETRTNEWRETCLQALTELEPERRMAALEKLRGILRKENHKFGPLWVDFGHAEVKRNGNPVSLTNLEFRLLRYLIERAGCLVSREELLRSVWGYDSKAVTRTVDMHIHFLRQKLEKDAMRPELIVTVKGAGYKFLAGVDDDQNELTDRDQRLNAALSALYDSGTEKRRGGLGASSPRVAKWLGDIREFFPTPVVQLVQKEHSSG